MMKQCATEELIENASVPVVLKPNAGLPKSVDGETVFDITEEEFADEDDFEDDFDDSDSYDDDFDDIDE